MLLKGKGQMMKDYELYPGYGFTKMQDMVRKAHIEDSWEIRSKHITSYDIAPVKNINNKGSK